MIGTDGAVDAAKASAVLFLAVVLQISIFSGVDIFGGRPDLLLVTLVMVALLRGTIFGAVAGFGAGLLYDMGTFGTLGFIALLYTLAGYWIGRYGETTGRDRSHAPLLSVAVVTVLFSFGALMLHFMLGENAPAREVLVESLVPTVLLNLLIAVPVYAAVRRILRPADWGDRPREVRLLG
jgi:rod shape-determining protein MreD